MSRRSQRSGRKMGIHSVAEQANLPPGGMSRHFRRKRSRLEAAELRNRGAWTWRPAMLAERSTMNHMPTDTRTLAEAEAADASAWCAEQSVGVSELRQRVGAHNGLQSSGDTERDEPLVDGESWPEVHSADDIQDQIRALDERLSRMLNIDSDVAVPDPAASRANKADPVVDYSARERSARGEKRAASQKGILSNPFFRERWLPPPPSSDTELEDDYGLDLRFEQRVIPILNLLYQSYFRVQHEGLDRIPLSGRCLIVSNHSGTVPLDGLMLRTLMRLEHPAARSLRWLTEDIVHHLPFVGTAFNRLGAVRACQENGQRLLQADELVAAFPEGVKGIGKLYRDRYRVQRFGRGGFIRLALRTQAPVVPCAIVGAEETSPMLYRLEYLPRLLGLPYLPFTPTFPWLGPAGLLPAPTKWKITFGDPILLAEYGPEAEHDHVLVGLLTQRVRDTVQRMIDDELASRRDIWRG